MILMILVMTLVIIMIIMGILLIIMTTIVIIMHIVIKAINIIAVLNFLNTYEFSRQSTGITDKYVNIAIKMYEQQKEFLKKAFL